MNGSSSVLLIFLLIVAAFAGLGYLVPEMSRQAEEIKTLQILNEETSAELERLINQNATLSQENGALHATIEEMQTENQILHQEITAQEGEISAVLAEIEEANELVGVLQQELEIEHAMKSALRTEKDDFEARWRAADAKNVELHEKLQGNILTYQLLQDENLALQEQLDEKNIFQEILFFTTSEMSLLSNMGQSSSSKINWVFLTPILLTIVFTGSYRYLRKNRLPQMQASYRNGVLDTKSLVNSTPSSVPSEMVTIQVPRHQLTKYIMWLRQIS